MRSLALAGLAVFVLCASARAALLGRMADPQAMEPQPGETLAHESHMLVRVGAKLISSSDLLAAPALARVSSFGQNVTGPQAALDALVFMTLWHDEVAPNAAVQARMRAEAQARWRDQLAALDSTTASRLDVEAGRVIEYMVLQQAFREYVQRRFNIETWPPTPAEIERRIGLEDKMRTRVAAISQRLGVEVLDPVALQRRVPGWSWSSAVERFLALGL